MAEFHLPSGHLVLLDDADLHNVIANGPWRVKVDGPNCYARRYLPRVGKKRPEQLLHTLLTGWPKVDHANGNGLDNRRANLRPATDSLNSANRTRLRGRSGYRGVAWHRKNGRWQAMIAGTYIGQFLTAEEAARAYDTAAIERWGEYARPNFPGGQS